jgi:hypothetical protein
MKNSISYLVPSTKINSLIAIILEANYYLQRFNNFKGIPEIIQAGYYSSESVMTYSLMTRLEKLMFNSIKLAIKADFNLDEKAEHDATFDDLPGEINAFKEGFNSKLEKITQKFQYQLEEAKAKADEITETVEKALSEIQAGIQETNKERILIALETITQYWVNNLNLGMLRKTAKGILDELNKVVDFDPNATEMRKKLKKSLKGFKGNKIWIQYKKLIIAAPWASTPKGSYFGGVNIELIADQMLTKYPAPQLDAEIEIV